jgi:hypothetical protein
MIENRAKMERSPLIALLPGDQENATFLAFRLRSCSHSFPFSSLSYEAGDKKLWRKMSNQKDTEAKKGSPTRADPFVAGTL